jgi:predicted phosphodiesterase
MKKFLAVIAIFIANSSCAPFVDSPFSDALLRPERDLNTKTLSTLKDADADGIIRIAIFADSHQNYKALDQVIYNMNLEKNIDFVVGLGDYTNSGYNLEYDQFLDGLSHLHWPKILAIGNHDSIGAGPQLFKKAFGDLNFYFESTSHRYIFWDSNNLEDPDNSKPEWLLQTVQSSTKPVFIFTHAPLTDTERFKGSDVTTMTTILNDSRVQLVVNGHLHSYALTTFGTTITLQCARVEGTQWLILEITGNQLCIKKMDTMETTCETLK